MDHPELANEKEDYFFKVIMLGDPSTGKTSFIKRYAYDYYTRTHTSTVGVDFAVKTIDYNDKTAIKLHLWDIPGQDIFICVAGPVFRGAHGALILFDMADPKTRESALLWKAELDKRSKREDGSTVPCLLLANKCDLAQGISVKEEEAIKTFASASGFIECLFTSVKYNICVEDAVRILTEAMIKRQKAGEYECVKAKNDIIKLGQKKQQACSMRC